MAEERVQRRLVAILVADVVGYSRMMREDEAGTLAQLKTLRKEVIRRQGDGRRHIDPVSVRFVVGHRLCYHRRQLGGAIWEISV